MKDVEWGIAKIMKRGELEAGHRLDWWETCKSRRAAEQAYAGEYESDPYFAVVKLTVETVTKPKRKRSKR